MSSIPLLLPKYIIPWLTSNSGIAEDSLRIASAIFAGLATLHEARFDQRIHLARGPARPALVTTGNIRSAVGALVTGLPNELLISSAELPRFARVAPERQRAAPRMGPSWDIRKCKNKPTDDSRIDI